MATGNTTQRDELSLEDAYFAAFKGVSDKVLKEAAYAYMEEGEYFPPRPANLRKFIRGSFEEKHNRELVENWTCSICHQKVSAIMKEKGECVDCAGLAPLRWDYKELPDYNKSNYAMEARIKCQACVAVGLCIKEPRETGQWQCRKCYTGLTGSQIAQRFASLASRVTKPEGFEITDDDIPF